MGRAIAFVFLGIIIAGFALLASRGNEDTWICQNGMWVKHGNPSDPKPLIPCRTKADRMNIFSPAFTDNGKLPAKYSCQGEGMSPPFSFVGVPTAAKSLALFLDDPDAPFGIFHHWLVWNIDPKATEIQENGVLEGVAIGTNSAGASAYEPACPPSGTHRYIFTLMALDTKLTLTDTATRPEFDAASKGHVIATATLTTRYAK